MQTRILQLIKQPSRKQSPSKKPGVMNFRLERIEMELESILRWEEDGGRIVDVDGASVILARPNLPPVNEIAHDKFRSG
jgi:hypothetical protein